LADPDSTPPATPGPEHTPPDDDLEVLRDGEIGITGRLTDASNLTLLGTASLGGVSIDCIYKPVRGERPLWDFPDGTLAERELAAYLVSVASGWDCVPPTIIRDGPYGPGMVQRWIADCDPDLMVDLVPIKKVPKGWLPVMRAVDVSGHDVAVVHADNAALSVLAGFDLVVNNADRKGSHVLPTPDGRVLGVDHGLCFHRDEKLRTILWGWAGRPLPAAVLDGLRRLSVELDGALGGQLDELITVTEMTALHHRIDRLTATARFPRPPDHRTPIPWPPL
jgi:uncharacterized repeat protein (TIGR03843 family)